MELAIGVFALCLVSGLIGYCNRKPKIIEVPATPVRADTVVVSDSVGRQVLAEQIKELEKQVKKLASQQPKQNLIEKHYITQPVMTEKADAIWGVRTLKVGRSRGDSTVAYSQRNISIGDTLAVQSAVTNYYTPGPLTGLFTDTSGVYPTFGKYEPPKMGCGFPCKAKWVGIGAGVAVVAREFFTGN